jgi:hypothetical protein
MARKTKAPLVFTVSVAEPMRLNADGSPDRESFKVVLQAEPLTASQIAAALVGGAQAWCCVCRDEWHACPAMSDTIMAALPATRAEYVAINAAHGITVTPLA